LHFILIVESSVFIWYSELSEIIIPNFKLINLLVIKEVLKAQNL